jgi:hypothetical protein
MTWIIPDWDDLRRYLGLGFCGDLEAAESRFVGSGKYRRLYRWGVLCVPVGTEIVVESFAPETRKLVRTHYKRAPLWSTF